MDYKRSHLHQSLFGDERYKAIDPYPYSPAIHSSISLIQIHFLVSPLFSLQIHDTGTLMSEFQSQNTLIQQVG